MTESGVGLSVTELQFQQYAKILDNRQNQRERLVKASRDLTADSKKLIFLLQRITNDNKDTLVAEAHAKLDAIHTLFLTKVAPDAQGEDFWAFSRTFSPGYFFDFFQSVLF